MRFKHKEIYKKKKKEKNIKRFVVTKNAFNSTQFYNEQEFNVPRSQAKEAISVISFKK